MHVLYNTLCILPSKINLVRPLSMAIEGFIILRKCFSLVLYISLEYQFLTDEGKASEEHLSS